jgi:hypothetical protein
MCGDSGKHPLCKHGHRIVAHLPVLDLEGPGVVEVGELPAPPRILPVILQLRLRSAPICTTWTGMSSGLRHATAWCTLSFVSICHGFCMQRRVPVILQRQ